MSTKKESIVSGQLYPGATDTEMSSIVSTTAPPSVYSSVLPSASDTNANYREKDRRKSVLHTRKSLQMADTIRKSIGKEGTPIIVLPEPKRKSTPEAAPPAKEKGKKGKKAPPTETETSGAEEPAPPKKGKKGKAPPPDETTTAGETTATEDGSSSKKKGKKGKKSVAPETTTGDETASESESEPAPAKKKGKKKK